ncbi:amidohydrolase [Psychrobacillus glaciei]|uniref:Amidohydrolase n=1 Tax=Psychrobacillus glaciei TaxID=2283160 RepID=A0A5J6SNS2_9BACI|nr:amidohydrolase [Psychrobacillus glaciei]QFF99636.1 amidohydrolase [Psychrobacillus glaciei]
MNLDEIEVLDFEKVKNDVVKWRRYFHQHPELSYEEINTSQFVYDTLKSFGSIEVTRPTKTSVMGRLIGSAPGKVLAMRGDMDALPITEATDLPFASENPGIMHACGHDGHTAMLLGAAKILVQRKDKIKGEVRFIFQHAEELFPGGAQEMVKAGVLDGVDKIIGLHLFTMIPTGKIVIPYGPFTANSDIFDIKIVGKGGHSSQPQETIDPIAIGAQVVNNIQHIIARNIDPLDQAVVSITEFNGGTAKNIIPDSIKIGGGVRSFNKEVRVNISKRIEEVVKGITAAHQATYEYEYEFGYASVFNNHEVTEEIEKLIEEKFDSNTIMETPPFMGGEDFSAFSQKVPGCFIGIGAAIDKEELNFPHHHPRFDIDERSLEIGLKLLIEAPFKLLN